MQKLLTIGGLALLLVVPLVVITSLVWERQDRFQEAVRSVGDSWSQEQRVTGPFLLIPFRRTFYRPRRDDPERFEGSEVYQAVFLPEDLRKRNLARTRRRVLVYSISQKQEGVPPCDDRHGLPFLRPGCFACELRKV